MNGKEQSYLRVRNWDTFQHYKDRKPLWIKVYTELLQDPEIRMLSDAEFGQLVRVWLLAGQYDNAIPDNEVLIQALTGMTCEDIEWMVQSKFLVRTKTKRGASSREKWPSRYIPPDVREEVLNRDEFSCVFCGASVNLELDHVKPVSRGGKSIAANLQTLCRSCNRRKRAGVDPAEHLRSKPLRGNGHPRSLEKEKELDIKTPKPPFYECTVEGCRVMCRSARDLSEHHETFHNIHHVIEEAS